jgi:hypothetical protein
MKALRNYLSLHREVLLAWVFGIMFALQIMNLHSYAVRTVDHQGIIAVNDDDAAWNVRKTIKTRWWKDNGWALYGPAYFRLNHTIHYFWGRTADGDLESAHENWEKTAHHAILTTSLLSLAALALLIACQVLLPWWQRFLFSFGLLAALTSIPTYGEFLLRAHPDHLCALVFAAAMLFTIRMLQEPKEPVWFWLAASLWGISVGVKMTLGLCVPGLVLLFVPPFTKNNFIRGAKFAGAMFLAYFIVGFPQTIVLERPIKMMMKMGSLSQPATLESITNWLTLYAAQLGPIFGVMLLAVVDFKWRRWTLPKGQLWRVWVFALLPFVILATQNPLIPSEHYTIPYIAVLLMVLALFWPLKWLAFFASDKLPVLRATLFIAVILAAFGGTPVGLQAQLDKRLECRVQARDAYARLKELYAQGHNIWVDPYIPYPTNAPESRVALVWEKSWEGYTGGNWTVMALNRGNISRFTADNVDAYTKADIKGWEKAREFYQAFIQGEEAKNPQGQIFRKIYQNSCNHEIWLRDK